MERVGYIYKYIFPNGKIYIGQTARNIKARFAEHCYSARKKDGYYLHNAIAKYGKDNIKIEIVETITDLNALSLKEQLNENEASKASNTTVSNIYKCLCGKNKTANGYIWKYKNK